MQKLKYKQALVILQAAKKPFTIPELSKSMKISEKGVYNIIYESKKIGIEIDRIDTMGNVIGSYGHRTPQTYIIKTPIDEIKQLYGLEKPKSKDREYWFILTR